jgi:type IV secretory pathway TraG/TraD family ATPase VirD4
MGQRLRDQGDSELDILKSKARRIGGVLPFVLIIAYLGAVFLPHNLKSTTGSTKSEKIFREITESAKSKLEIANAKIFSKQNSIRNSAEFSKDIQQKINRAKSVEEKSKQEDRLRQNENDLAKTKNELTEVQASIRPLEEKLQAAREDLTAFREGRNTSLDSPEKIVVKNNNTNVATFMWYGFLFLLISIPLSYPMGFLINNEQEKLAKLQVVASELDNALESVASAGLIPFEFSLSFFKGQRQEEKIQKQKSTMQIGKEKKAYLTDRNLNYHTQIIGGSCAGKTNLLKVMLEDRIAKGHAIIFFDFKGEVDLVDWMAGATEYYGRRDDLAMISMADPKTSYAYNPISLGTETEISSQIMNAFTWSESFYKNSAENALLIILKAFCYQRDMTDKTFHLGNLYQFLTDPSFRMDMVSAVGQLNYPEMFRGDLQRICEELSTNKKENYLSLITQISKILNSSAGEIVAHKIGKDEEFNLKEAMSSGKITYFMMNNLKLKETAAIMGKFILQDLMKTVGNIYDDRNYKRNPVTLIIDEFASFATPDFGEFIEKARGAGISIVVTYQSRKSLDHIEQSLALKMNENTANKVVFQAQDSEDVEWFCSLLGTKTTVKETNQAESGLFGDRKTGAKSIREVEEYVIHPNEIKKLKLGQALLYCSKIDPHYVIMNIKKANEFVGRYERSSVSVAKSIIPKNVNAWPVEQKNSNSVKYDDLV